MFQHFYKDARRAVVRAEEEANSMHHPSIGPEHLLLGLMAEEGSIAQQALTHAGLDLDAARNLVAEEPRSDSGDLDADALASIGIDLDAVRRTAEQNFGEGALERWRPRLRGLFGGGGRMSFNQKAKKSMELALRTSFKLKHSSVSSGHLLVGILEEGDNGALRLLARSEVDTRALRADVLRRLSAAA